MLFKKKKRVPEKAPRDHYSVSAITRRTAVLRQRADDFMNSKEKIYETTTKVQLIFPFLKELGWDVSDPKVGGFEVIAGDKNKADVMLTKDKAVKVVLEAKATGIDLDEPKFHEQLAGYFEHCHASIGILTDGVIYEFFSFSKDSEEKMDTASFARVDIRNLRLGERNAFLLYLCEPHLDIEKLVRLSRVRFTRKKLGAKRKKLSMSDRTVRDSFISDFPECTSQEIDELIEFANYHCR